MSKIIRKRKKLMSDKEQLETLDKSELIDRILRLQTNNEQLRIVINKIGKKENVCKTQKPFDFTRCNKRHILLKLYYLGWDYNGFVIQEDTGKTIEEYLFAALKKSCCIESRETSNYHRCGRTDKGVSSFSQVISLDVRSKLEAKDQNNLKDELPYCKMLNRLLPPNIRCIAWCPVPNDFSARFNCKYRTYKYLFPRGNLDINAMNEAIQHAKGEHDFRNICKMDVANGVINFKRSILDAKVSVYEKSAKNNSGYDICELTITGQAFLWHQIRCIMGILILVGQGKEKPDIILDLLNIKKYPRKPQYNLSHELPLNLWHCDYDVKEWFIDEKELLNTIKVLQKDWTLNTIKSVMIKNMLADLESSINHKDVTMQSDSLLIGVQPKVYQPLIKRDTCESLENKIKHYEKKGKFEIIHSCALQSD